jgi:hypothetical protein
MTICKNTARAYYPVAGRMPDLIRGSGRIRYVRGSLLLRPKGSVTEAELHGGPEKVKY